MEASLSKSKVDDRLEFTSETRRHIYKRAGAFCTRRGCIKPTFSADGNLEILGPQKATSTGKACHIYSASKNGPRGQGDKSPDFIKSTNNGFWACGSCHDEIDCLASIYSAETLFEMKRVRETAQRIARSYPAVSSLVGKAGMQWLDDLVWASPDRDNTDMIADAYVKIAEKITVFARSLYDPAAKALSSAPVGLSPLMSSISNTSEMLTMAPLSEQSRFRSMFQVLSESRQRERAYVLAESWSRGILNMIVPSTVCGHLMVISPSTRQESEVVSVEVETLTLHSKAESGARFDLAMLIVNGFGKPVPWLDWSLNVNVRGDGELTVFNRLRVRGFPCPESTLDRSRIPYLQQISSLLRRVLAGESLFIKLAITPRPDVPDDTSPAMHPDPFELKLGDSRTQIEIAVDRIDRTLTCFRLAEEFGTEIIFTRGPTDLGSEDNFLRGVFSVELTEEALRSGIKQVLSQPSLALGPRDVIWSEPLVQISDARGYFEVRAHLHKNLVRFMRKIVLPR